MRYAIVENGVVGECYEANPAGFLAPGYAARFVEVPDDVRAGWRLVDGVFSAPPGPAPETPVVSMRQARRALQKVKLLKQVNAAIAAMTGDEGEIAQIEWDYSQEVRRDWPTLLTIAPKLGLTDMQLDALFVEAAKL